MAQLCYFHAASSGNGVKTHPRWEGSLYLSYWFPHCFMSTPFLFIHINIQISLFPISQLCTVFPNTRSFGLNQCSLVKPLWQTTWTMANSLHSPDPDLYRTVRAQHRLGGLVEQSKHLVHNTDMCDGVKCPAVSGSKNTIEKWSLPVSYRGINIKGISPCRWHQQHFGAALHQLHYLGLHS